MFSSLRDRQMGVVLLCNIVKEEQIQNPHFTKEKRKEGTCPKS